MKPTYNLPCNIAQTLNIVGDRWTLLIIHEILIGNTRFNDIKNNLNGISSNLLSERLKYLEDNGLISTTLYSNHPPRYAYTLTESGNDLKDVFNAFIIWGEKHLETCYKTLVHDTCNHEVEISYYCPHCEEMVDHPTVVELKD
ncbi:winged helix-turn-helix transcriptional regulator [Oceanobacillus senegalensis]|uniref:winged helix-turn-helix transcriptional regulator n=1 Tax=Oceanobacillus senegalensis TaxID=1936063 RepID=UPI000A309753|nr:helix-turn-helix domain-containing protein [Oceanobacillus senegalensis]